MVRPIVLQGEQMSEVADSREPQTRVEQAAYVIQKVESLGVRVHPASRLMQMLGVLERGHTGYNDSQFPVALESIRDMYQVRLVVDQMDAHREDPKFRASVVKMLKDAALPQNSSPGTEGRDAQLELYLAAVCLRAGLVPVEYNEPDVTCTIEGLKFGIAAKRLKSLNKFEDRVKKGADQIRRARLPGVVVLDLTIAHNPENRSISSGLESQLALTMMEARNCQFFEQHERDIYRWVAGTGVRALLVFEFMFRVSPDYKSWIHDGMMFWFPTTKGDEHADRELALFEAGFKTGMPNVLDLAASRYLVDDEDH